jgi:hypothetical protein
MKIYRARLMDEILPKEQSPLPIWQELIDLSDTQDYFTDDPYIADRIVFIDLHQAHHLNIRKSISQHWLYKKYSSKILVWNETDRPIFDVRGLYVNVPKSLLEDKAIVPIPYLHVPADSLFHGTNFSTKGRTITCTYRGTNTHKCRNHLCSLQMSGYSIIDSTKSDSLSKTDFLNELDSSIHAICPRGHGLCSFRLYEAMARGCLPVIVADNWIAPKVIPWDRFCTFVKEAEVPQLPTRLMYSNREISRRQGALMQAYSMYLAPNVRMNYFLRQISDVPVGECLTLSNATKVHNVNLILRRKLVSLKRLIM